MEAANLCKETCAVCRYKTDAANMIMHSIIPKEITTKAGISDSEITALCKNCWERVSAWYLNRVSAVTYDWGLKRFRSKSAAEMVKEYEIAYDAFVKYERWRQHIAQD